MMSSTILLLPNGCPNRENKLELYFIVNDGLLVDDFLSCTFCGGLQWVPKSIARMRRTFRNAPTAKVLNGCTTINGLLAEEFFFFFKVFPLQSSPTGVPQSTATAKIIPQCRLCRESLKWLYYNQCPACGGHLQYPLSKGLKWMCYGQWPICDEHSAVQTARVCSASVPQ